MKKTVALLLAVLLILSTVTAFAEVYKDKPTVKAVQQALNDAGYNCGTPDGSAGKKTKAAVTQFQTDKGLEVTGQIDDALLEALGVDAPGKETEANNSGASANESAGTLIDWNDYNKVLTAYVGQMNIMLTALGVDDNEDVGQSAYIPNAVEQLDSTHWRLYSEDPGAAYELRWAASGDPSMVCLLKRDDSPQGDVIPVNLTEYASISTSMGLMSVYVAEMGGDIEDIKKVIDHVSGTGSFIEEFTKYLDKKLENIPTKDGTVDFTLGKEVFGEYVLDCYFSDRLCISISKYDPTTAANEMMQRLKDNAKY